MVMSDNELNISMQTECGLTVYHRQIAECKLFLGAPGGEQCVDQIQWHRAALESGSVRFVRNPLV